MQLKRFVCLFSLAGALPALAQTEALALGAVKATALFDGYYSYNFNHPESHSNRYRNFDTKDRFGLGYGRVSLDLEPGPVGFHVDVGGGRLARAIYESEPAGTRRISEFIPQAYLSLQANKDSKWRLDVGKFFTSAGAEVTETAPNFNYSRSLLFAMGPYFHFGARLNQKWNSNFSTSYQLVNGWNSVLADRSRVAAGITSSWTVGKVSWSNAYYGGRENVGGVKGARHFYDTVLSFNPGAKVSGYLNVDIGSQHYPGRDRDRWEGVGGALRFQMSEKLAVSPRLEWFNDRSGFMTGTAQALQEATLTVEYRLSKTMLLRGEHRHDWGDFTSFDKRNNLVRNQATVLVGIVMTFGSPVR